MPTMRNRASPPDSSCTASVPPRRRFSASARPRPTSASSGAATRRPDASGGSSKTVWSPGNADEAHGLAQRVGVRALHLVAQRRRLDARDPLDRRQLVGGQRDRDVVALAQRAGVVAQRHEQGREREQQRDDGDARAEHRDGAHVPGPSGRRQSRAEPQRAGEPTPAPRPRGVRELRAAQQRHGAARGRPQRGPRRRGGDEGDGRGERDRERAEQRAARRQLVERREEVTGRPGREQGAERESHDGRGQRDDGGTQRVRSDDRGPREAERALDPDRGQAPLHVGVRRHAEHHARRPEHDGRERDEQRQHDPCRLVEQHPDAVVRDEAQVLDAEARGARLLQRDVDPLRVVGPHEGHVRPAAQAVLRRDVDPRRRRQREGDVVGAHGDPGRRGRCRSARRTACRPRRGAMRGRRRARRRRRRPRVRRGPRRSRTRACPARRPGRRRGGSSRSRPRGARG